MSTEFYLAFENRFRGSTDQIAARLSAYLPLVEPLKPRGLACLDIGCGRGEWLHLLQQSGFQPTGIDTDPAMVALCQAQGLPVVQDDALARLIAQPAQSVVLVTAFHLAEHLPFPVLRALVAETLRVLVPGGLLILETPNPENLTVGTASFYMDPTHERPLPSDLLAFVTEYAGFDENRILRLQETEVLRSNPEPTLWDVLAGTSPDYAVVARKPDASGAAMHWPPSHSGHVGLSLQALANRFSAHHAETWQQTGALLSAQESRYSALSLQMEQHKDQHHAQLAALLQQVGQQAIQLTANVQQADARFAHLEAQLASCQDAASHAMDALNAVYFSKSWRLTHPLRAVAGKLRWLKGWLSVRLESYPRLRHALKRLWQLRATVSIGGSGSKQGVSTPADSVQADETDLRFQAVYQQLQHLRQQRSQQAGTD